jgi:uncharacterized protein YjiS (DUF1127 family)
MLQCSKSLRVRLTAAQQKEFTAMATLTNIAFDHPHTPVRDVLHQAVASFAAWRTEQRKRARIARELATYTDRELFDLGIQRADVPAIINGTYTR